MELLHQLIQQVNRQTQREGAKDVRDLKSLFNDYQGKDWKEYLKMEQNTLLFQNEYFKLILIYWDAHKKSKKHGHPQGGGLIKVLSGTLLETRFDPKYTDQVIGKTYLSRESEKISYIHDSLAYHIVENPFSEAAFSLHLYATGIYTSTSRLISPEKTIYGTQRKFKPAA